MESSGGRERGGNESEACDAPRLDRDCAPAGPSDPLPGPGAHGVDRPVPHPTELSARSRTGCAVPSGQWCSIGRVSAAVRLGLCGHYVVLLIVMVSPHQTQPRLNDRVKRTPVYAAADSLRLSPRRVVFA